MDFFGAQDVNVRMEMSLLQLLEQRVEHLHRDNDLIGVGSEHVLNQTGHGKIHFVLDV